MNILSQMSEELGAQDANRDAEVPLPFVSLGSQVEAVVMRLQTRLPRIKVAKVAAGGETSEPWPRPAK